MCHFLSIDGGGESVMGMMGQAIDIVGGRQAFDVVMLVNLTVH